ncbi:prephenate dehydrogenase [Albimonas pacifica]|uniref:Prephenate dehydrogenase n=1 Tax=Albimonas pacifica TaxID=1114924 RepID=A0A1I3HWI2_9RHOB|nr:prephenate dehydrogenase [Albimonas pacifica]SFI40075.1 prephenate dehydrogenase [Albimonas pacifica]
MDAPLPVATARRLPAGPAPSVDAPPADARPADSPPADARPVDARPVEASRLDAPPGDAPSVALIGFGAFGRLLAAALSPHARISVLDPRAGAEAARLGHAALDHPRQATAEIVILAVPLPALEGALRGLAPHLRPGQLVVDVCSVKEEPARLMRELLPEGVELLASHPMFGPASARDGMAGRQVVLCPLRGRRWRRLAAFLRGRLGLEVIVTTPEAHDREAALTQGLTHLLARAVASLEGVSRDAARPRPRPRIRTRSFELIAEALAMVADDAPEVYEAVTRANRHVPPLREALLRALSAEPPPDPGR